MNAQELAEQMAALSALLPQMQAALKERAVQEVVEGGAAVAVRPWSFRHPLKGETDAWFGLAYQDWVRLRREGFTGVYAAGEPDSERPKMMIVFDEAAAFLKARAAEHGPRLSARVAGSVLASDEERGVA